MKHSERPKRRATTVQERMTPCQCCGYELSQRHHLIEVSMFGENDGVAYLCANCHELYHLIYNALFYWDKPNRLKYRSVALLEYLFKKRSNDDRVIRYLEKMARQSINDQRERLNNDPELKQGYDLARVMNFWEEMFG